MTRIVRHSLTHKCNPDEMLEVGDKAVNPLEKDRLILANGETRPLPNNDKLDTYISR